MKRFVILVISACVLMGCKYGTEIHAGELVEDSITTDDAFANYNEGSYYKRYRMDVTKGKNYRLNLWTSDYGVLCLRKDHKLAGMCDFTLMYYASTDGEFAQKEVFFGTGGTWYFFVYVRAANIEPGEEHEFRFRVDAM